ncbi:MAG: hypothetical protein IIA14_16810, partial [SAR324 cluster bacterium]|nr:hypothetical protein [SAR324 cluster bacterium]
MKRSFKTALLTFTLAAIFPFASWAACTTQEQEELARQGLSSQEIARLCDDPAGPKPRAAVLGFRLIGVSEADGELIVNKLRSELVKSELFQVMTRDQLNTLLEEQALGQTLIEASAAAKAGKLKGVKFAVTGSIIFTREAFQTTFEMIDAETGRIINSITPDIYRGDFLDFLDQQVPLMARQLLKIEGPKPPPAVAGPPPSPSGVSVSGGTGAEPEATIRWQPVAGANFYNLYWSNSPGVNKTKGVKISGVNSPFVHRFLTPGRSYYYVVTAVNAQGESRVSSEGVASIQRAPTVAAAVPRQPTPAPPPPTIEPTPEGPSAAFGFGVGFLVVGGLFEFIAILTNADAEITAQDARDGNDAALWQTAL